MDISDVFFDLFMRRNNSLFCMFCANRVCASGRFGEHRQGCCFEEGVCCIARKWTSGTAGLRSHISPFNEQNKFSSLIKRILCIQLVAFMHWIIHFLANSDPHRYILFPIT